MADTTTPNIKITNQTEGGNSNTWGTIADDNFERIDNKFGDQTSVSTTGGTTALSDTQEIVAIIDVSGTLVSNAVITFSGRGGSWIVANRASGSYDVTCKVSGQTGVEIPQGGQRVVYCNGTDIVYGNTEVAVVAEVTVGSATICDILGQESEFIAISGTTTITSFGTGVNVKRFVRATGAFLITHNATTLICPGGQNITTKSGDTFIVISDASSQARIYCYQRAAAIPAGIPPGSIQDYAGTTAPDYWLLCYGQTLSRTTYAALYDAIGTTYGSTDSSNFLLPDCRGRVRAGKDNMGGSSADRLTNQTGGLNGDTLGATGGTETHTLTTAQMPAHTHTFSATSSSEGGHSHTLTANVTGTNGVSSSGARWNYTTNILGSASPSTSTEPDHTHTVSGTTSSAGSTSAHNNVQPTIIFNTIIFAGV